MLADRIAVMSARPGRLIDIVETGWPRERDSRIIEHADFGVITARLWKSLREESLKTIGRPSALSPLGRMRRATWYRLLVVAAAIAMLEVLCLTGVIDKITMQAPHLIVRDLYRMLVSGRMNGAIVKTLTNTLLALGLSPWAWASSSVRSCIVTVRCGIRSIRCSPPTTRCRSSRSTRSFWWCSGWATCRRS